NETGISQPTLYYQLLKDVFIGVRMFAWTKSGRKHPLSTPKFLLFDLGVRRAAAGLEVSRATGAAAQRLILLGTTNPLEPGLRRPLRVKAGVAGNRPKARRV
ncbi:MAG TPA: hypothetical protein VHY75_00525, partial [Steroidobacteraceae bacterium]|nr:hypothetical protein [Steroidobacteraceae bacterium]